METIFEKCRNKRLRTAPTIKSNGITFVDNIEEKIFNINYGDRVDFIPEPDNKFDQYAVKIVCNGEFMGYMPKKINTCFLDEVDAGHKWHGKIANIFYPNKELGSSPGIRMSLVYDGKEGEEKKFDALEVAKNGVKDNQFAKWGVSDDDVLELIEFVYSTIGKPDTRDRNHPLSLENMLLAIDYFIEYEVNIPQLTQALKRGYDNSLGLRESVNELSKVSFEEGGLIPSSCYVMTEGNEVRIISVSGTDSFWTVEGNPQEFAEGAIIDFLVRRVTAPYGDIKIVYV